MRERKRRPAKEEGVKVEGEKIWVCEDSQEGIFTGIYDAWASGHNKEECVIQVGEINNYRLFAPFIPFFIHY